MRKQWPPPSRFHGSQHGVRWLLGSLLLLSMAFVQGYISPPRLDLNGLLPGKDINVASYNNQDETIIVGSNVTISGFLQQPITSATIRMYPVPDGIFESLAVQVNGQTIKSSFISSQLELSINVAGTMGEYENILSTVAYKDSSSNRTLGRRFATFIITNGIHNASAVSMISVDKELLTLPCDSFPCANGGVCADVLLSDQGDVDSLEPGSGSGDGGDDPYGFICFCTVNWTGTDCTIPVFTTTTTTPTVTSVFINTSSSTTSSLLSSVTTASSFPTQSTTSAASITSHPFTSVTTSSPSSQSSVTTTQTSVTISTESTPSTNSTISTESASSSFSPSTTTISPQFTTSSNSTFTTLSSSTFQATTTISSQSTLQVNSTTNTLSTSSSAFQSTVSSQPTTSPSQFSSTANTISTSLTSSAATISSQSTTFPSQSNSTTSTASVSSSSFATTSSQSTVSQLNTTVNTAPTSTTSIQSTATVTPSQSTTNSTFSTVLTSISIQSTLSPTSSSSMSQSTTSQSSTISNTAPTSGSVLSSSTSQSSNPVNTTITTAVANSSTIQTTISIVLETTTTLPSFTETTPLLTTINSTNTTTTTTTIALETTTTTTTQLLLSSASTTGVNYTIIGIVIPLVLFCFLLPIILFLLYKNHQKKYTFYVRVVEKSASDPHHPRLNEGCEFGYEVKHGSGSYVSGKTIYLRRGKTYTFKMVNVARDFPFYITYSEIGGGNGVQEYLQGIQGSPATDNDSLRFSVPLDCPSKLFYQSTKQKCMGYIIYVSDDGMMDRDDASLESVSLSIDSREGAYLDPTPSLQPARVTPEYATVLDVAPGPAYIAPPTYQAAARRSRLLPNKTAPNYHPPPVYETYRPLNTTINTYDVPLLIDLGESNPESRNTYEVPVSGNTTSSEDAHIDT